MVNFDNSRTVGKSKKRSPFAFYLEKDVFFVLHCLTLEDFAHLATVVTGVVSLLALIYAMKEYKSHKDEEKANTLAKYNERYSSNEHLIVVVEYLYNEIEKSKRNKKTEKNINADKESRQPTPNEKELFLRFFEEIQISIEQGALDKAHVKELFFYYAKVAYDMGESFICDFNHDCWRKFRTFVESMK